MTRQNGDDGTERFERSRTRMRGIAYRMLGSLSDADDAVQDVYLKWRNADHGAIENAEAWLVTACTRRCIDMLRAAHKTRVDYVGPWLPEPVVGAAVFDGREEAELASSLAMAFLLLLERLGPVERAAYLLREIFGYSYQDVSFAVGRSETACRQLVSRAKKHLAEQKIDQTVQPERHEVLLTEFMDALRSGETQRFSDLLAEDVRLLADGGGKVPATLEVIANRENVSDFLSQVWQGFWRHYRIEPVTVNGSPGAILHDGDQIAGVLSLDLGPAGKCVGVYVVRNPDKLRHVGGCPGSAPIS